MVKLPQSGLCHVQAKAVSNGYAPPEAWGFSHAFCQTVPNSLQVILQLFFSKTNKMKFYLTKSAVYRSYLFEWVSESHSVVSDSLWPHGLYSPWNSPGQDTGVGSLSLLQGIFPTQGWNPGLPYCRRFFTSWATREAQVYCLCFPLDSKLHEGRIHGGLVHCLNLSAQHTAWHMSPNVSWREWWPNERMKTHYYLLT